MQSTLENNVCVLPTGTIGTFQFQPQRNICSGCGKCNVCGRPDEIPNSQPYTSPYPATWITYPSGNGLASTADRSTAIGGIVALNQATVADATGYTEIDLSTNP